MESPRFSVTLDGFEGTGRDALDRLVPAVYQELQRLARGQLRNERAGHTLTTTALVHEAYLRLARQDGATWANRNQFLAVAAQAMRRILVDYARRHRAGRRGGPNKTLVDVDALRSLSGVDEGGLSTPERADAVVALDEALERLGMINPRLARIVECRFFAGLSEKETAEILGVSQRTVARDWVMARGWLYRELHYEEH